MGAVVLAVCGALAALYAQQGVWLIAGPLLGAWMLSPAIAWWASRHLAPIRARFRRPRRKACASRRGALGNFFETFVTAEDNSLPPDNFQEDPHPVVAHRTSPTNLGLYLLSILAARDFGWLGLASTVDRLEETLATMNRLERFRGHFYNWYDTRDLRPLDPRYVSSVDSGNLAGHLITLRSACREMLTAPVFHPEALAGIADAVKLARNALDVLGGDRRISEAARKQLYNALDSFDVSLKAPTASPADYAARLVDLKKKSEELPELARALLEEGFRDVAGIADIVIWTEAVASVGSVSSTRRRWPVRLGASARIVT